jgi:hypothetical protein
MKKIFLATALLLSTAALAAGPFDGTWKTQLDSVQFPTKPDVYALKDGVYTCSSCVPPFSVKADGSDQKVSGHPYYDTVAVQVVDAHTVQVTGKLAGKPTFANTSTVSADGATLTTAFKDMTGAQLATGTTVSKRLAAGAPGSHALAGSWKGEQFSAASDTTTTVTYKMTADGLQMHWNGQSYDAKFDGKPVLTANDPGKTWVSLKRIADNTIEETDTRDGKVVDIYRITVAADGKTLTVVDNDVRQGTTSQYKMTKQP